MFNTFPDERPVVRIALYLLDNLYILTFLKAVHTITSSRISIVAMRESAVRFFSTGQEVCILNES